MRSLVYAHLLIAFCAVALTAETFFIFEINVRKNIVYLFLVFFSTLLAYNFKTVQSVFYYGSAIDSGKKDWSEQNKGILVLLVSVCFIVSVVACFFLAKNTVIILFLLGLLSLGYSFPLRIGKNKLVLREIPFIKTILVSFVWAMVVCCLPFIESGAQINKFWGTMEFLFLFPLAILFDIKDLQRDKKSNVKTLPILIGVKGTKILSVSILITRAILIYFLVELPGLFFSELISTTLIVVFIIFYIKEKASEYFYMVFVDGLLLLKFLISALVTNSIIG